MAGISEAGKDCKYSHDPSLLKTAWIEQEKKLKLSKFSPSYVQKLSAISSHLTTAALHAYIPDSVVLRAVYKQGAIILSGSDIVVDKVLFDSGALNGSYIDKNFVDLHRAQLEEAKCLRPVKVRVKLANNSTDVEIEEMLWVRMRFEHCGVVYTLDEQLCVMDMNGGNDVIIGLPTIVKNLGSLFQSMLEDARDETMNLNLIGDDNTFRPWPDGIIEAPEDVETPMPCSFSAPLHYLSMPRDEAVLEYRSLFDLHVSKEFAEKTEVLQTLMERYAQDVFVPEEWTGINGLDPIELDIKPGRKASRLKARPVNPKIYESAHKEFLRLQTYFYVPSMSEFASPIVLAPKSSVPYVRFCGDYQEANMYLSAGHQFIPMVEHELHKIIKYRIFLDMDMKNAFHQLRLGVITSEYLSVKTPWGQFRPLGMPEGISPATGILQKVVKEIFKDFDDWMIVIFDNFLVLAYDYVDAHAKLVLVLQRCKDRNLHLNFKKSYLGFDTVNFFGYFCRHNSYETTEERKQGIMELPFPDDVSGMRRFLGMVLFCSRFIPKYVELSSPLHEMTKKNFDWDSRVWQVDYKAAFALLKVAVMEAQALYYPDYELPWKVFADASKTGISGQLVQFRVLENGETNPEVVTMVHSKFSDVARRWPASKQECYALFKVVNKLEYYLRPKAFVLVTDLANLRFLNQATDPLVIRWRMYLQSFNMYVEYLPGKLNFFADYLSRIHVMSEDITGIGEVSEDVGMESLLNIEDIKKIAAGLDKAKQHPPEFYLQLVHGGRMGHHGVRRTYSLLNEYFEGHRIPYHVVSDFVTSCVVCQKLRLGMTDSIQPVVRHLKVNGSRSRLGIDTLTFTPQDIHGNSLIHVITNQWTHHSGLYPAKEHTARTVAAALFQHVCLYGMTDELICDPASNFTAEVVHHLMQWLGIRRLFSLVDRHESNGVEGQNKLILRHLAALVADERIKKQWSDITVLPIIGYLLNSWISSETGFSPFHLTFGNLAEVYNKLPADALPSTHLHEFIQGLEDNLRVLHDASQVFQQNLILQRTAANPERPNQYQAGDFILFQQFDKGFKDSKLTPDFSGPFEVIKHESNNVECKHVVGGFIKVFHTSRVKIFHGNKEQAYTAALLDNDQFVIKAIVAYRGEPLHRTSVQFLVHFEAGAQLWLPWSQELFQTIPYEEFCRARTALYVLVFSAKEANAFVVRKNKEIISGVDVGDKVYVDLRSYGADWYDSLNLPLADSKSYVLEYRYTKWSNAKHTKIVAHCKTFNETFTLDGYFVFAYGSIKILDFETMILVDADLVSIYPALLPTQKSV